jgi:phage gpG-like protein
MSLSLHVTHDDISPALAKLVASARNPEPVVRAMGTTFYSITKGTFEADESFRPTPWPPKKSGGPSRLRKSNTLFNSIFLRVEGRAAIVGSPMIYAAIHQFGKPFPWMEGQKEGSAFPARPYFPILKGRLTAQAEKVIAAAGQRLLAKQLGAV